MLQKLNHTSRAYILQQQGLPGFVQYFSPTVLEWLKDLTADGKLSEKLPKIKDLDVFMSTVLELNEYKRDSYFRQNYPKLCIQFLQASGRDEELRKLCKGFRNSYELYTFYIKYYLEPKFESLRRDKRLKKGNNAHFKRSSN